MRLRRAAAVIVVMTGLAGLLHAKPAPSPPPQEAWIGVGIDESGAVGVRIIEVIESTPAFAAGLVAGDEILSVDKKRVATPSMLIRAVSPQADGETVELLILRDGKRFRVEVTLELMPTRNELIYRRLVGRAAPEFDLPVVAGPAKGKLASLRGQVVFIEFWATWCNPCLSTHPALSKLAADRADDGLVTLAISGESEAWLRAYVKQAKPAFTVLRDPGNRVQKEYFANPIPTIVVVDRRGVVCFAGTPEDPKPGMSVNESIATNVADAVFSAERALRRTASDLETSR